MAANEGLDHNVRNALVGMALEIKRIMQSMQRMETYLKRIDKACGDFPDHHRISSSQPDRS